MMNRRHKRQFTGLLFLIYILALAPTPAIAAADLQFTATVDRTSLALGERVTYTLEIQSSGGSLPDPKWPALNDFQVLSGPNQFSSIQIINFRKSVSKTYSLVLTPAREGTLTIPAAELTYEGKLYRTQPIVLTIGGGNGSGGQPSPAAPQTAAPQVTGVQGNPSELFVQVTADKIQAYQQEQIILTYTIYVSAGNIGVSDYQITKLPNIAGAWVEEMTPPARGQVQNAIVNGKRYQSAIVRQIAVFPTPPGELVVDPLELTCQVQVMAPTRRGRSLLDQFFSMPLLDYQTVERILRTEPLTLKIQPLPEANRPADFDGVVGNYKLDVMLEPQQARTNEALTMKVRYSGTGNLKMLPAPKIKAPTDFEAYDPKESTQINNSGGRISGSKVFEYVFIPRHAGTQKIAPLSFSYFDPAAKSYRTLSAGGYEIQVEQGAAAPEPSLQGIAKEEVKLLDQDIHYLKTPKRLFPLAQMNNLPGGYLWGMILPPALAFMLLIGFRVLGAAPYQTRRQARKAYSRAHAQFRALAKLTAAGPAVKDRFTRFYGGVHRVLLTYLGERLKLPAAGLKEEEVLSCLSDRSIPPEQVQEVAEIFNICNYARFAPENEDASRMDQFLKRARQLLDRLEQQWEKTT